MDSTKADPLGRLGLWVFDYGMRVPRFPGFLNRFRGLLAPPGRPSEAVGVPASGEDAEKELRDLLAELEVIGAEADRIVNEARDVAGRRHENGLREAEAILQEARGRAETARARAASERRDAAERDGRGPRKAAAREVDRIMRSSEERLAALVAEVLECVRHSGR